MIWVASILLTALALLGLARPWWSPRFSRPRGVERRAANVALYRQRLEQLPGEVSAGTISAESAEELKSELAARLLADAAEPGSRFAEPLDSRVRGNEGASVRGSRALAIVICAVLLVFAGAWYAIAGSWRTQALIDLSRTDPDAAQQQAVDGMIEKLEAHLKDEPRDADSWIWLARSYRGRERYDDAARAFGQASALKDEQDPDVLTEQGEALAAAQDKDLRGAPAAKFQQALALAPEHPRALWYAGIAAVQTGDDRAAIEHWERLLRQEVPDDLRGTLEQHVRELRERNHLPIPRPAVAAASGVTLHIAVSIKAELAAQLGIGDTLFVYAVDPAGPPIPLAVKRFAATSLPVDVTLDDASSMTPARKLSSVSRWRVVARVSRSGNAMPQAGDLEGSVELGPEGAARPLHLVIDQQRP